MGRRRLEKKLEGLTTRAEQVQQERTEPQLALSRLTDSELELLDRLVAKYIDNWGQFEDPESEIWWVALLAKALHYDAAIPSTLPEPPELPPPSSCSVDSGRRSLFGGPDDPRPSSPYLLEREPGETEE